MKAKASSTRASKKTHPRTRQRVGSARPRADQLSAALFQIADAASAAQNLQEFYATIHRIVGKLMYAENFILQVYDDATQMVSYPYVVDTTGELRAVRPVPLAKIRKGFAIRVLQTGATLHIGRAQMDALVQRGEVASIGADAEDWVGVPLKIEGRTLGVLVVQSYRADIRYRAADVRVLEFVAQHIAIALTRARALEETRQRVAELQIINSVQQGLASQLDMQAIYDLVGEKIRDLFNAQVVMISTYDHATKTVAHRYAIERGTRIYAPGAHPPGGFRARIIETREPLLVNTNVVEQAGKMSQPTLPGTESPKSWLGVPMLIGNDVIGVMSLQNLDRENAFSESDVRLLQTLASSMSVALENARLFAETNQRAAELAIINNVGAALAQQLELQRVIELVGEKIRDVFDAQAVGIALHDQKHKQILYPYTWNRGKRLDLPSGKVGGLGGHVIKTRQPLVINRDFAQRAAEYRSRLMTGPDYPQAGVYVPILIGENVLGTLTLLNYERENVFADSDVRLIETIAANMGVAIQNARLFEELQVSLTTTTRLAELSAQMLTATTVEETARFVTRALQQAFAADVVSVDLLEANGEFRYWDSAGLPEEFYQRGQPRPDGLTRRTMDLAEPLIIQTPELLSPATRALGVQSTIALPLRDEKSSLGVLFLNYRAAREFDQREIDALSLFANQTALAVKRLRLIEETQQRAAELAIINGMGDALAGQIELDALIQLVGDKLRATFRADIVYIALLDRAANSIRFPYFNEHGHARAEPPLAFGQGLTSKIIETRQPLLMNQDLEKKRSELGVARQGTPARAYLGVPILVGDEAIGVISVQSTAQENRFGDAEQRLLTTIAAGVGVAMERARLYQTTQSHKQYFEALVQNSPVAIVTIDLGTRVTEWNPAAERLFGYTRAEAIGNDIDDLVAREETLHAEAIGYSQRGIMQGGIFHAATKRQRKDGSRVDVDMWGVPIFSGEQRVGVYAMYVDITELEHARRDAIAANDAKSAFLATMSHEIRTPMNAIIGMSGLLLNTDLTRDQREFAEIVRNSGEGLLTIINDILDFSKIEAAKMELERAPFDLRDALESSLDLVAATAAEKGLDLACVIEDGAPPAIIGDVTRFRQILLNLLNNAVKFTERGEVVLEVGSWKLEVGSATPTSNIQHPTSNLHFSVRDAGIGIPPDRIDRLFQSFTQVDASTTRKYGGTGLGLAISKRLVELMGGAMWVESASGIGTTFHFTVPFPVAPEFTPRARAPRDHSRLTGKRLLIVDDNATNRRILVLQTRGWEMIPRDTASPREALAWIQNNEPFDLAILDMQMPEMDGMQLARALREQRDARALPLVMFSSLGQRNAETDALGFVAFLKKPLKQSQLLDALIGIFGAREPAPQTSVAPHLDTEMATRSPLRILLAEDNAVNQKLALRLLAQLGYRADVAANGIETLQAIARQQYDVVLMDVQMPEMDGLEATRAIRKGGVPPPLHQPRIIAMTANAMQGDREMCLSAGMDDYISKPIRVEELIRALSESAQMHNGTRTNAEERG
ncbi:MAG: GAF domain-containing protein [Chloroflexi bacterium]|nr:GAF domain-containing protein [Chloroflexota bacterium]